STLPSIGRAATRLGMTQPVLSRRLRALEHVLGFTLLERSARGVALTAAGASLAADAVSILEAADHLRREVSRAKRVVDGRCVLGGLAPAAATELLARVTARCAARYPDVQLRIEELTTPAQHTALLGARIDLGVAHRLSANRLRTDGIVATRVLDDPLEAALVRVDHALASRRELVPADLMDMPFLFMDRSYDPAFYDRVLAALAAVGVRPRIEATYDDRASVWALVAQGKGWTVAFHSQLGRAPVGTAAVRIAGFTVPFGLELLLRRSESSPHVRAVASLVRALRTTKPRDRRSRRGHASLRNSASHGRF